MAKIRFSKTELKRQRDMLKQFTRFLPTLQLKKQQLQSEVVRSRDEIAAQEKRISDFLQRAGVWIGLFSTGEAELVGKLVEIEDVELETRNIAGVDIPVLNAVRFAPRQYSLFETSAWTDAGMRALEELIELDIERQVLKRQCALIEEELRTTTQRVNLFEKVKIPETRENIRVIQIYLGDQQTAAVGRAKIAKNKLVKAD